MPELMANGTRLFYTDTGDGEEVVVFSHSYLVDLRQFEHQIAALSQDFRVIAYDHRDHGRSATVPGAYTLDDITQDGLALLDGLGLERVHWIGLSTGGFVGQRIALQQPERLRSLVLMDTSALPEPRLNRLKYRGMFAVLRLVGFGPVIGATKKALFGPTFLQGAAHAEARALWTERIQAMDPAAIIRFGNAIFSRGDILPELRRLQVPTLVVVGEDDRATTPTKARALAGAIPGARLELIPDAGHLSTIEQPEAAAEVLRAFLAEQ